MLYYHVLIIYSDEKGKELYVASYGYIEEDLKKIIADPFNEGKIFWVLGTPLSRSMIKNIYIFASAKQDISNIILPNKKVVADEDNVDYILDSFVTGKVPEILGVATAHFISPMEAKTTPTIPLRPSGAKNKIFIVHGTDYSPVNELKAILEEAGLKPIILHEQPSKGMTIIEKLEKYSDVGFTFIILTPDDFGVDKKEIRKIVGSFIGKENCSLEDYRNWIKTHSKAGLIDEVMASLKERARQNVVLEFGYFMGRLSREKICCLYKGDIELPSDMQGICYVHFNRSVNEVKSMILNELKEAGYEIRG